jgi:hypothetical protein
MRLPRFARLLSGTFLCLLIATAAFAQSDRGTITGTVSDPASAVVPGAKVVARNTETGSSSDTTATDTGNYTLPSLPAGNYDVTAEAPGFKKTTRTGVVVQVAQTLRVDIALTVGAATESVTVTAEAPLLKTESGEQSMNLTGERINSLPLNFGGGGTGPTGGIRNWLSFVILAPGVSGTAYNAPINGSPGGAFKIYLEGQDVTSSNDTTWTSIVSAASVESIGEFSVQTSNFSPEYGQVLGGVFNFTTKSGTNQVHGSGYEYLTNEDFNAARPFTHALGVDRKHDFGFSVGGPVWIPKIYNGKNKTFFFFSLEEFRVKARSSDTLLTVPTAAYRTGDFSRALTGKVLGNDDLGRPILENAIYDPGSDFVAANGKTYRNLYPGNIVPQNLLDKVAMKIQGLLPAPTTSDLVQNYRASVPNHKYQSIPSIKVDHSFSDTAKLSGYWSVQNTDQLTGPDGLPYPISAVRVQQIYGHNVRLNFDKSFTPRFLVHLGAGYMRFHNPDSSPPEVLGYDAVKNLGLVGSATNPSGFPYISSANSNAGGLGNQLGPNTAGLYYNDKLTSVANATYVRENHTFKLGAEFKQEVWSDGNFYQSQGFYNFNAAQTALPGQGSTSLGGGNYGFPYASFLLGQVQNASVQAPRTLQWRKKGWGLYLLDNWKITRKLTIEYGVRWDYAGQGHELHYRTSQVGVSTPNPSAGGLPGGIAYEGFGTGRCNCNFVNTYPYAIGPRLSAAYQLNEKTVLRAGWGVSYSGGANWWYVTGGSSSLGVGFNSLSFSNPAFGQSALQLANGLHYNSADLYTATLDPGIVPSAGQLNVPAAWGGQINDPNGGRPARVNQWNLSLQREVARGLSVEAAYVGNRGVWLEANGLVAQNAIQPATFAKYHIDLTNADDRTLLTSPITSAAAAARGITKPYASFPNSGTVAQALRPFPEYNDGLSERWAPLGNSWYDGLQVKVTKRYSHGLDLTSSFSWQKEQALGTGGNPGPGGGGINDVFNRANQKSLQGTSTPFILVIGFNYSTPKLSTNRWMRQLTGGWNFGGVLRYASGALIGVPASRNNLGTYTLQGGTRMNRVAGQSLYLKDPNCGCIDPTKDLVLNPNAWVDVGAGQWGSAAPYYSDYRWQRQANEDLNFGRTFQLREKMSLQVRAEFFNAFNRLKLSGPSATNPTATTTTNGASQLTGGYGFINFTGIGAQRNGQLVARFTF